MHNYYVFLVELNFLRSKFTFCLFCQMAEAGFFHSPNDRDPDIARCFVCFKELEGWEPEDNPMYVQTSNII